MGEDGVHAGTERSLVGHLELAGVLQQYLVEGTARRGLAVASVVCEGDCAAARVFRADSGTESVFLVADSSRVGATHAARGSWLWIGVRVGIGCISSDWITASPHKAAIKLDLIQPDHEVALQSPGRPPGVLDDPVFFPYRICSLSDHLYGVSTHCLPRHVVVDAGVLVHEIFLNRHPDLYWTVL